MEEWGFEYKTCAFAWVKKNKKVIAYFGVWVIGHEQM